MCTVWHTFVTYIHIDIIASENLLLLLFKIFEFVS